ncbi:MAG: DsrE/DsrF/DrsH-like family protein, partial [Actinomycetota bacterium]
MTELHEEPTSHAIEETAPDKLVIFAWSGDLDRMWPTLILATSGAAMGMRTTVFFTFWGLFPLVKNEVRITGENWMQKMLSTFNRGGTEHLKLSKMQFLGAGPAMMKKLADEHKVASPTELLETARDMGVRLVP